MQFRWLGAPVALVSALVFQACSSREAPKTTEPSAARIAQPIQGGEDDGPAHPYAVGICRGRKGRCLGVCSGTLILPNLVVTARHCVDESPDQIECDKNPQFGGSSSNVNWITTSENMAQSDTGWHAIERIVRPNSNDFCGKDIALLVLADVIDSKEAEPAIPGVQYSMTDDRYSRSFTAVGYGLTAPETEDNVDTAGTRRIRHKIDVRCIPGDERIPCPPFVNPGEFVSGDGTCEGDSGSGALETSSFVVGKPVSFGMLSRGGESDDHLTCQGGVYTRLDQWRDLVVDTANEASKSWTLYPKPVPDWTIYVPPPPPRTDAGTKPKITAKPKLDDGYECDDNSECVNNVCADTGGGKACTKACDSAASGTCADGMYCKDAICVYGTPPAVGAPSTTTTTTGCSMGPAQARNGSRVGLAALIGGAIAMGRRRRKNASEHV